MEPSATFLVVCPVDPFVVRIEVFESLDAESLTCLSDCRWLAECYQMAVFIVGDADEVVVGHGVADYAAPEFGWKVEETGWLSLLTMLACALQLVNNFLYRKRTCFLF